ncbi:MAG: hypothetical protein ACRD4Y_06735 [Candidatus Acidiferrales bacterium]
MERKYKQRGYMSDDKPPKKEKRAPEGHPRHDQIGPRTPRMVGTVTRARCSNCGNVLQPGFDPKGKCPKCGFDLHSCKQCAYFDTAARFECMKPVPERIARKDQRNDCAFYEFRTTIEKDTAPSAPMTSATPSTEKYARPLDARQAFENLFKK